jgi:hypothetical protein
MLKQPSSNPDVSHWVESKIQHRRRFRGLYSQVYGAEATYTYFFGMCSPSREHQDLQEAVQLVSDVRKRDIKHGFQHPS